MIYELFGELRSLAHGVPSASQWDALIACVDQAWNAYPMTVTQEWVPYLMGALSEWPLELRIAPSHWFEPDSRPLLILSGHKGAAYLAGQSFDSYGDVAKLPEQYEAPGLEYAHWLQFHDSAITALGTFKQGFVSVDVAGYWRWWDAQTEEVRGAGLVLLDDDEIVVHIESEQQTLFLIEGEQGWRIMCLSLHDEDVLWQTPIQTGCVDRCQFSPDGNHVVVSHFFNEDLTAGVSVWSIFEERIIWCWHSDISDDVYTVLLHPNGTQALSLCQTCWMSFEMVSMRDVSLKCIEDCRAIHAAYSPDGRTIVSLYDGHLHIWDVLGGEYVGSLALPVDYGLEHQFSGEGKYLCVGVSLERENAYLVYVFDIREGKAIGNALFRGGHLDIHSDRDPYHLAILESPAICAVAAGQSIRMYPLAQSVVERDLPQLDLTAEMKTTLTKLNTMLFELGSEYDEEWLAESKPEAFKSRWLGLAGASEDMLLATESRLGRRLPPSFRAFLLQSNGWLNYAWFPIGICDLLGTEDIYWAGDQSVLQYQSEHPVGSGRYDDVPVDWFFPWFAREQMLVIGSGDGNEYLFLNPCEQTECGEWEVWSWHHECGFSRYVSFFEFLKNW